MSAAVYDTVQVELEQNQQVFKANGSTIKFAGYQKVYQDNADSKKSNVLPELVEGDTVSVQKIRSRTTLHSTACKIFRSNFN